MAYDHITWTMIGCRTVKSKISNLLKKLLKFPLLRGIYQKISCHLPTRFFFHLRNLYFVKNKVFITALRSESKHAMEDWDCLLKTFCHA